MYVPLLVEYMTPSGSSELEKQAREIKASAKASGSAGDIFHHCLSDSRFVRT